MFFENQSGCSLLGCAQVANSPFLDFTNVGGIVRFVISSVFVIIIIFGILMVIKATVKIIRSEGDPTKVQEGFSIVRGVLLGVVIIFVGIIGMVVVISFFGAGGITNRTPVPPSGLNIPL
ncbi:MAG: hypothetical protein ABIM99_03495 [Candidatus Dojkabacteria bacterium]